MPEGERETLTSTDCLDLVSILDAAATLVTVMRRGYEPPLDRYLELRSRLLGTSERLRSEE